jgi:DNA-directed RNA polymerase specialized sigma24 family protein
MGHDAAVTEDELAAEFRRDAKSGLEFLDVCFRRNIFAYLKSLCRYAQPADLADIYQDTMLRLVRAVQQETFSPANPMALVTDIAFKAATDFKRRKKVPPIGDANEVGELLGGDLSRTKTAMEWRYMLKEDIPAFRRSLDRAIDELPTKQKIAAAAMIEVCEEVYARDSFLPLRERIRAISGEPVTTVQAYDNWRAARPKLAERLRRAGFDFFQGD